MKRARSATNLQMLIIEQVVSRASLVDMHKLRDACDAQIRKIDDSNHMELLAFLQSLVPSVWDVRVSADHYIDYRWRTVDGTTALWHVKAERWSVANLDSTVPLPSGDVTVAIHNQVVAFIKQQEQE